MSELVNCILCKGDLSKGRKYSMVSAPQKLSANFNTLQLLTWVLYEKNILQRKFNPLTHPQVNEKDTRYVCSPCCTALKNVYESITALENQFQENSYVGQHIVTEETVEAVANLYVQGDEKGPPVPIHVTVSTSPMLAMWRNKTVGTPVGKKMKKAMKNSRQRSILTNSVKKMLRLEMKAVTTSDLLKSSRKGDTFLPKDEELNAFVRENCPMLRQVLLALFQRKAKVEGFNSYMRLGLGLAAWVHNQRCNSLQKTIAIILYKNQTAKKGFNAFHEMGICLSYTGLLFVLDEMRKKFDEGLLKWKQDATEVLLNLEGHEETDAEFSENIEQEQSFLSEVSENEVESEAQLEDENVMQEEEEQMDMDDSNLNEGASGSKRGSEITLQDLEKTREESFKKPRLQQQSSDSDLSEESELSTDLSVGCVDDNKGIQVAGPSQRLTSYWKGEFRTVGESSAVAIVDDKEHFVGITLTFDNINRSIRRREYNSKTRDTMMNFVSSFAVYNRVPILAEKLLSTNCSEFMQLPMETWYLTDEEVQIIKQDHTNEILRILSRHLKIFTTCRKLVPWYTPHQYSSFVEKKSQMVNLGILPYNEQKMDHMLQILSTFDKYQPRYKSGRKLEIGVFGDGGTTNSMKNAQNHYDVNCDDMQSSHKTLIALNSPWHRKLTLLQDEFNVFMPNVAQSYGDGTLSNFRSRFGHNHAKQKVKEDYNNSFKLFRFTVESYILAMAMKLMGYESKDVDHIPQQYMQYSLEELMKLMKDVANQIADFTWHNIDVAIKQNKYCFCHKEYNPAEIPDEMYIGCDNYNSCRYNWFHRDCLSKEAKKKKSEFISPRDSGDTSKTEKFPKRKRGAPKKSAAPTATASSTTNIEVQFFCSKTCQAAHADKKLLYSKAIMFGGLNFLAYHSSIRNGDGLRMRIFNKLQLPQMIRNSHSIYFRISHRLLGYMGGAAPEHIKHDLMNNCTFNHSGGPGKSLGLDLCNEILNLALDGVMKRMSGNMTDNALTRASQSFQFVDEVSTEFENVLNEEKHPDPKSKDYQKYAADFNSAIAVILAGDAKGDFLSDCGPRFHEGFENFNYTLPFVDNIAKLTEELRKWSVREDQIQRYCAEKRTAQAAGFEDPVMTGEDVSWLKRKISKK